MLSEFTRNLWDVNPIGAVLNSQMPSSVHIKKFVDASGYSDGAFKVLNNGVVKAGIGGFLKDKHQNLVYIFSGPTEALSPLQAEIKAFYCLIKAVEDSQWKEKNILFHVDVRKFSDSLQKLELDYF
ncbi:hypothetical protein POM88_053324 [Heracleum sosnowskyi]|uniref:Uncharacterized protein n=1 Tax=Heracleum sosnowskyi TaxID=360622 RepID=A0AAD8GP16_9APIA|nr:hypothetical protein POM88_053324 [Heracleum sosnowskyi]